MPKAQVANSLKQRLYAALETPESDNRVHRFTTTAILSLIVLNVFASIVETVPGVAARNSIAFALIESLSVAVFVAEYVARVWAAGSDEKFSGFWGRLRFAFRPAMLVDAIATFPALLIPALDFSSLRMLRMFRLLRGLKLVRYSKSLKILANVLRAKGDQLMLCLSFVATLLVLAASLLYFAEHQAQPEVFSSIPATMWWAVCTLTTVGYGDVYPITVAGKLLASMLALFGVGLFALPAGILASGFTEESENTHLCPKCGETTGSA